MKKIAVLFYIFITSYSQLFAQDVKFIENMTFEYENGHWYKIEGNKQKFKVDEEVITIKLQENKSLSNEEYDRLLNSKFQLEKIRRNKHEHIDLKICDKSDIFSVYEYLITWFKSVTT